MNRVVIEKYNEAGKMPLDLKQHLEFRTSYVDGFLTMLKQEIPDEFDKFMDNLAGKLSLVNKIDSILEIQCKVLDNDMVHQVQSLILENLNYEKYDDQEDREKLTVENLDYLRSFLRTNYLVLESLAEIISRQETISLFRRFVDAMAEKYKNPQMKQEKLDFEKLVEHNQRFMDYYQGNNAIVFDTEDGKVGMKISKCLWHTAMSDLEDRELCDAISCYYDFPAAKNMNPYFVLLRQKTLQKGDICCNFLYLDTRIHDIDPLPDEFWLGLV